MQRMNQEVLRPTMQRVSRPVTLSSMATMSEGVSTLLNWHKICWFDSQFSVKFSRRLKPWKAENHRLNNLFTQLNTIQTMNRSLGWTQISTYKHRIQEKIRSIQDNWMSKETYRISVGPNKMVTQWSMLTRVLLHHFNALSFPVHA